MKKLFYILFTVTFLSIHISAQSSITWSRTYGQPFLLDYSNTICNTGSGYYYVGGYATAKGGYLLKINEFGDTIWTKFFPFLTIKALVVDKERGCILAGNSDSLRVTRIDSNGNTIWEKKFFQNYVSSTIVDVRKTTDSNYIACGYRFNQQDGVAFKFDENGNLFWIKIYPANYFKIFYSIAETPDRGYIATGEVKDFDTVKTLLLRLDSAGNMVWERQLKIFNQPAYGGYIRKINNSYFIAGQTFDTVNTTYNERLYFIRVDTGGSVIYEKLFTFHKSEDFYAAFCISENRFIFSSLTFMPGNYDTASYSKVMITDSLGNILTSRNFYGDYYYGYNAITGANNSDILLAGSAKVPGSGEDFLVSRVDSLLQGPPIGIKKISNKIPEGFVLNQNYPNPFNPVTSLKFDLPKTGFVSLKIYDVLGREVIALIDAQQEAGIHEVVWNAKNFTSGIYFYKLQAGDYTATKKMMLVK